MSRPLDAATVPPAGRIRFGDAEALSTLRAAVFRDAGIEGGIPILYGLGFAEGMAAGLRIAREFSDHIGSTGSPVAPAFPLVLGPWRETEGPSPVACSGDSLEARVHRAAYPQDQRPVCFLTAGWASGWYSALLGTEMLVVDRQCAASGAPRCVFVAWPVSRWEETGDPFAREILPFLDFEGARARASSDATRVEEGESVEGAMLGRFDPMSPAVHVWGPVMVLPFSGSDDARAALTVIEDDIGRGSVRAAVVDVTGTRIDAGEALGLARLLDELEARQIEVVIVGLRASARASLRALALPLVSEDLSHGIALAFQLATGSRDG